MRTALVTGGSRNIGKLSALAIAAKGVDVIITYNEKADLAAETVKEIEALGVKAMALQVNFTDSKNIPALVEGVKSTLESWGKTGLDILINNAGTLRLGMFNSLSMDDLDAVYNTNYRLYK
jgi:NAD(P)-dependent dehydrogenase (short-subunit alcohol dehydrogenase family)